ncbi:MAG: hypothetical protein RL398_1132, partial [Planctomycetota bacterium]
MSQFPVLRPAVAGSCLATLVAVLPAQDPDRKASLERAAAELPPPSGAAPQLGDRPTLRLVDVSMNLMTALGTSTERDGVLADLKGGAHDAKKRGFTLQQAELSLVGAVDPYFT